MSRKYCAPRRVAYPLRLLDWFVDALAQPTRRVNEAPSAQQPRILMMSSGHLGDTLILTFLFPLIIKRYPQAKIDVLAGDWCDPVLVHNPFVRRIIHWNHIGTNRRKVSGLQKVAEHVGGLRRAIAALSGEVYDYSVDVRFSDSPMHQILPFIRVKHSIGFGTRGLGGLLDDELFLPDGEFHHLELILNLLSRMDVHATLRDIRPYFPHGSTAKSTLAQKLPQLQASRQPIIAIFPESGADSRFLPDAFWQQLLGELLNQTEAIMVGCGQRPGTTQLMHKVIADNPSQGHRVLDATGQLTIDELAELSAQASLAFTLESFPAHLCGIFCPLIAYYVNGTGLQFFPIANFDTLLFHNHQNSRDLTLDRPHYQSLFVDTFDSAVVQQSVQKATELVNRVTLRP
ncbi:glycosyltransferase family 9 protein [Fibrella sp. HMF5335]|uniref:Glycosyltransferase family 9 protein n=1 Tax=Fibrella rubiginis TaxID=2817060 RepID=A0A939GMH9_9BACT|nr:glycosyltransferase family 9 protein [Fibrella rubiginis]MBO0939540.1 glycosyltransferase family 9 protein [Fibrella rubiginis]